MSIRELIEHAQNLVAFAKSDLYQCNTSEPLDAKFYPGLHSKTSTPPANYFIGRPSRLKMRATKSKWSNVGHKARRVRRRNIAGG